MWVIAGSDHRGFGLRLRLDLAHHDPAGERDGRAADVEAVAVLILPGRADDGPVGGLAGAFDMIEAVGRLAGGVLLSVGHGVCPFLRLVPRTISRHHGISHDQAHEAGHHTPAEQRMPLGASQQPACRRGAAQACRRQARKRAGLKSACKADGGWTRLVYGPMMMTA